MIVVYIMDCSISPSTNQFWCIAMYYWNTPDAGYNTAIHSDARYSASGQVCTFTFQIRPGGVVWSAFQIPRAFNLPGNKYQPAIRVITMIDRGPLSPKKKKILDAGASPGVSRCGERVNQAGMGEHSGLYNPLVRWDYCGTIHSSHTGEHIPHSAERNPGRPHA